MVTRLAFAPCLECEVALGLLRSAPGTEEVLVVHGLQVARSVSHLTHPNVIPVFEFVPGALQLGEKALALLRTLRSQGVVAFRPSN